jgi:subtilisin family serine protease
MRTAALVTLSAVVTSCERPAPVGPGDSPGGALPGGRMAAIEEAFSEGGGYAPSYPPHVEREAIISLVDGADPEVVLEGLDLVAVGDPYATGQLRVESVTGETGHVLLGRLNGSPDVASAVVHQRVTNPEADRKSLAFNDGTETYAQYAEQSYLEVLSRDEAHALATGEAVVVAVLDTGVDLDHVALAGVVSEGGWDFIDDDAVPDDVADGVDGDGDGYTDAAWGHGTHVAGIVHLVAPDARILPFRVLDDEGWGTIDGVVNAIVAAVEAGAHVINLSLGTEHQDPLLEATVEWAFGRGVVLVSTAGNRDSHRPQYPGAYHRVLSVTAVDAADVRAPFANYGPEVIDMSAPGVGVMSCYPDDQYAVWSGTSMAAPHVSGALALVLSAATGDDEDDDAGEVVQENGVDIDDTNPAYEGMLGDGRLDLLGPLEDYLEDYLE